MGRVGVSVVEVGPPGDREDWKSGAGGEGEGVGEGGKLEEGVGLGGGGGGEEEEGIGEEIREKGGRGRKEVPDDDEDGASEGHDG